MRKVLGRLLLTSLVTGCAVDAPDEVGETTQSIDVANGVSLNGVSLNGVSLNGVSLNGVSLNGVSLDGASLDGVALSGSTWTGTLSNGAALPLRIDGVTTGTGTNADVAMYTVSYQNDSGWSPLCGVDAVGAPVQALAVPGEWNTQQGVPGGGAYSPDNFTFACRFKTIAKCVEMGYKPWSGYSIELQSCVRLLRADYCGDGTPNTQNGTTLDLYDADNLQIDTETWIPEAEWTPAGARCISAKALTRYSTYNLPKPWCIQDKVLPTTTSCGTTFANGAVLIDELPPSFFGDVTGTLSNVKLIN
jgi:ADYC domain-containing protein/pentapeptide repeat protein